MHTILKRIPRHVVCEAVFDFLVKDVADTPIEITVESALEEHGQIARIAPVALAPELSAHPLVEDGPGQWISDRHTDLVGPLAADQVAGGQEIFPGFGRIAELDEPAGPDA